MKDEQCVGASVRQCVSEETEKQPNGGSRIASVTVSMMKQFMQCRRRFYFEYIERLKPRVSPLPLSFGSAVHAGLEALFCGHDVECMIVDSYGDHLAEAGPWPKIAEIVVTEFDKQVDWRAWKVRQVEERFEVKCGYAKRLLGKLDALAEVDGQLVLLEHKTALVNGQEDRYRNRLLWDDQATAYLYAVNEMGLGVSGILYNVMCKPSMKQLKATPIEARKFKKDRTLCAGQRENDETDAEFIERVAAWYREGGRFFQHFVYRTEAQLEAARERFRQIMLDMAAAEREGWLYPNPRACEILACPFESICLEDTPEAREMNFVLKEARNEELLERVDGDMAVNF